MHVIRQGGRYLAAREYRCWIGLAGIALVVGGVLFMVREIPIILAVFGAGGLAANEVVRTLIRVRKGRLGEWLVADLLRCLPDDYYLVNDLTLGRRGNIDHVLVGPCGVVVIETKRVAGTVRCYGDDWYVNGHRRKSISKQANGGALLVKETLRQWYPDLAPSALRFIESVVVFTHPLSRLAVDRPRTTVVRYSELLSLVRELASKHKMSPALAARLAKTLSLGSVTKKGITVQNWQQTAARTGKSRDDLGA